METKVTVNMKKGISTVKTVRKLFDNPAKRFMIDVDGEGWSAIEKKEDGYYFVNYSGAERCSFKRRSYRRKRQGK